MVGVYKNGNEPPVNERNKESSSCWKSKSEAFYLSSSWVVSNDKEPQSITTFNGGLESENEVSLYIKFGGEGWFGFPDLWYGQNPWWNWYLTPVVKFVEIRMTLLDKSILLTFTLLPLGSFQIFYGLFRC